MTTLALGHGSLIAALLLYVAATFCFFVHLYRGHAWARKLALALLIGGVAAHGFYIWQDAASGNEVLSNIRSTLSIGAGLIVLIFALLAFWRTNISSLGVFVTPIAIIFLLFSALGRQTTAVSSGMRQALLPAHIAVNVLGLAALTLAAAAAVAYVVQDYVLKEKTAAPFIQRLPALDVLDRLGIRAMMVGFPLLTLGLVSGVMWMTAGKGLALSATQTIAIAAWLIFGTVLVLRASVGWRGRRAALGTLLGFLCALFVLAGYFVRGGGM